MSPQPNWLRNEFARAQDRRANIPPAARTTVVRPATTQPTTQPTQSRTTNSSTRARQDR